MNKSFIKGLLAGIGIFLGVALIGLFFVVVFWTKSVTAPNTPSTSNRVTIGTPSPKVQADAGNVEVSGNKEGNPTEAPEVNNPTDVPAATVVPAVTETPSATDVPETGVTATEVPEPTKIVAENTPTTAPATPTPTPTRVLNYNISRDLLSSDFEDKLLLLGQIIEYYYYQPVGVETLQEGLYKGIMDAIGDPYTCYYTPEEYDDLMESTSGTYCGIGAYVSQNINTMLTTIVRPFVDGPAYKAGIKAGDIVVSVDGVDVTSMELTNIVAMMKGPENTKVNVRIYRESSNEYIDMVVTRAFIDVPTVEFEMLENKIGYIAVTSFDEVTESQFKDAVNKLTAQGMKKLIIDLRDNGGGLLDVCVNMADYILDDNKLIVYTEDRIGESEKYTSHDGHIVAMPVVVLVNEYSASASEVFTGALRDNNAATVVGVTSFGKGIVQSIFPLTDGSAVKLTTMSYFCPSGVCIHGIGITPDIVIEQDYETEEDEQLQAAIDFLNK